MRRGIRTGDASESDRAKGRHLTNPIYKEFTESRLDLLYACAVGDWRVEAATVLRSWLRGRGRGRSVLSRAKPEGRRGWKVGVFGAGHVFPIVTNLRCR